MSTRFVSRAWHRAHVVGIGDVDGDVSGGEVVFETMRLAWTSSLIPLVACAQVLGISSWQNVDGPGDGGGPDGGADTNAFDVMQGDAGKCNPPVVGGTAGVIIQNEFCIDSIEAPVSLYDKFRNDLKVDPAIGQGPECAWNKSYDPPYTGYDKADPFIAQKPQIITDWCDAMAYCRYWGKHLCGNRKDGGPLAPNAPEKESQWYTACTNGTSQTYPYGNAYNPNACNSEGDGALLYKGIEVSPTSASCQGGVPGVFDMAGNVEEFENSCDDPLDASAACITRGGTYFFGSTTFCSRYGPNTNIKRDETGDYAGIRCCWEPK